MPKWMIFTLIPCFSISGVLLLPQLVDLAMESTFFAWLISIITFLVLVAIGFILVSQTLLRKKREGVFSTMVYTMRGACILGTDLPVNAGLI